MKEKALWKKLKRDTQGMGEIVRVENPVLPGYPDVDYVIGGVAGKLELKVGALSQEGCLRLRHYSIEQLNFARRWTEAGGISDLLLYADGCYYWFTGADAGILHGRPVPYMDMRRGAWWWAMAPCSLAEPLAIRCREARKGA